MPVIVEGFPVPMVVDGIISYLQWVFGNPELVPDEYRWNINDRASRIRISAPFVIDNEKPMSAPFIVVERGSFNFQNGTIDNLRGANSNTFENKSYADWANGPVNITIGSSVAPEASNLASFLAIMFQADRHGLKQTLKFVRNLNYVGIGPETPVVKYDQIHRWEVTLSLSVSVQFGWLKYLTNPVEWNKCGFWGMDQFNRRITGEDGNITIGSDLLVDNTKDFGFLTTNNPQILQRELENGWYYIWMDDLQFPKQPLKVVEVVNPNTLRLETYNEDQEPVPWSAPESLVNTKYTLLWNSIHLRMELPGN